MVEEESEARMDPAGFSLGDLRAHGQWQDGKEIEGQD